MSNEKLEYMEIIRTVAAIISVSFAIAVARTDLSPSIVYGSAVFVVVAVILLVRPFVRKVINYYNNRRKRLESNKIAKRFFEEFKDSNFMSDFKFFIADSTGLHTQYAFHFIIKKLLEKKEFKGKIPEPPVNLINLYFSFWTETFTRFDATKEDLKLVFFNFEYILQEYYNLFIKKPKEAIKNIDCEVPEEIKTDWNKAADDHDEFARKWNNFCEKVNRAFGMSGLPSIGLPNMVNDESGLVRISYAEEL